MVNLDNGQNLTVHVGLHKAASTYLQSVIPATDLGFYHLDRPLYRQIARGPFDRDAFAAEVQSKVSFPEDRPLLISNEGLSGHSHGYAELDPEDIANRIKQVWPATRILLIIRNQLDYLMSLYTYRVANKGLESASLQEFIDRDGPAGLYDKLCYDELIAMYYSIFGTDNVHIQPFEDIRIDPLEFVNRILKFSGSEPIKAIPDTPANVSVKNIPVLKFWRFANRFLAPVWPLLPRQTRRDILRQKTDISIRLGSYFSDSPKLEPDSAIRREIADRYRNSNRRTEKLTGIDLSKYNYPGLSD